MMNKLIKIVIPSIAIFGLIIGIANADHHGDRDKGYGSENHDPEKKIERLTEKLALNESQQKLLIEFATTKKAMHENHKNKREENMAQLNTLAEKEVLEVSDINNLMEQKAQQRNAAMQPVLEKFVAFRNSLTTEQRTESKKMIQHILMGGHKGERGKRHHKS